MTKPGAAAGAAGARPDWRLIVSAGLAVAAVGAIVWLAGLQGTPNRDGSRWSIDGYVTEPGSTEITLYVWVDEPWVPAEVAIGEQTADRVVVNVFTESAEVWAESGPHDHWVFVLPLEAPLGDRAVVDHRGNEVPVWDVPPPARPDEKPAPPE